VSRDRVVAIGDGANDLPMLRSAGLGVAFCAKPAVREAAPVTVSVKDLSAVLCFLGYDEREFTP
jgi:phosphoserine phosphatase